MIEAAAFGDLPRLREACEALSGKEIAQIRCKMEIPKEMVENIFGAGVKIREKYRPKETWNPAIYAIATAKVEVLKFLFGSLKANPKFCLADFHRESITQKDRCFGLFLALETY